MNMSLPKMELYFTFLSNLDRSLLDLYNQSKNAPKLAYKNKIILATIP